MNKRYFLEVDGRSRKLSDLCREYGIPYSIARKRIALGWDVKRALTEPARAVRIGRMEPAWDARTAMDEPYENDVVAQILVSARKPDGYTCRELGEMWGCCGQTILNIETQALKTFRENALAMGIPLADIWQMLASRQTEDDYPSWDAA